MKFKSQILTEASGSVGGLTFSHNRGGLYTRARSIPTDPATALQAAIRASMAALSARWRGTLTAAQRAAWDAYALATPLLDTLGEPRNVGGIGMYQRGNVLIIQSGVSEGVVDDGPVVDGLPGLNAVLTEQDAAASIQVTFDDAQPWTSEDGAVLLVFQSPSKNAGINFYKGPYRFVGSIQGDSLTPPTSPESLTPTPFTYVSGAHGFGRVVLVRQDGRVSLAQRLINDSSF